MNNTNGNMNQGAPVPPEGNGIPPHYPSAAETPGQPTHLSTPQGTSYPQHQSTAAIPAQDPTPPVDSTNPTQGGQTNQHAFTPDNTPFQQAQPTYRQHQAPGNHAYVQPPVQQQGAPAKKSGGFKTFALAFLGAALAVAIGLVGYGLLNPSNGDQGSKTILGSSESSVISADEDTTLAEVVANKALPSVVNIDVFTNSSNLGFGYGYGYDDSGSLVESSLGSGVVLSEDGYIITNYHVIEVADALEVTVGDETYEATVVGTDPSSDLAVIKAEGASGLTPIEIGSSSDLALGEWVMTIGSPFGLEQSVATGIVSATSRSQILESTTGGATTIYTNLIQTDAAINPGNSGGALVDSDGKLIGINTLITSYSGNYSGVGFAIPVDYAIDIAEQIISGETPTHAQLGVNLSTVNSSVAERYGLAVDSGAYISQVFASSGAEQAGLQVGDIITKFDDQAITSASDLMLEIRSKNPGDTATLEYNRRGETRTVEVTLGSDSDTLQSSSFKLGGTGVPSNAAA